MNTRSDWVERDILVLADSDSRWKWGLHTAAQLLPGAPIHGVVTETRHAPSDRQLAETEVAVASVRRLPLTEALEAIAAQPPRVVVLAMPGGGGQAILHWAARTWPDRTRRPIFVCGYVGVVYEKMLDGLLMRAGADLILANGPRDERRFTSGLAGVGADPSAVVTTRLSFLGGAPYRPVAGRPYTVTFAPQPGAPAGRADREYVLRRLIQHATLHPERDVVIKLRGRPGEALTHAEHHPYQLLGPKLGLVKPPNLYLVYGSMREALDETDLLLTVSSTAAVEAIHRGIPTGVLTDFGIREALGSHYFAGSGCLLSFADLDAGAAPVANPDWAADHGLGPTATAATARGRLAELMALADLPPVRPFYTDATAPELVAAMLDRYGLAERWDERDESVGVGHVVRHAVRVAARHAYRQGVHTVAPTLRKLARL